MNIFWNLLPLLTFIIGILLTPLVNRIADNYRLKKLEKYFYALISLLLKQIESQIPKIENTIDRCDDFNANDLTITRISGNSLVKLSKINHEDLFKIYILRKKKNNNIEDFKNLNKLIDFIDNVIPHMYTSNLEAIDRFSYYRNLWNNSQIKVNNIYNQFINSNILNGITVGQDHFIDSMSDILNRFSDKYGNELQNLQIGFNELIEPAIDLSISNSQDPRSMIFLSELQNTKMYFREIETVREDHKKFLESILSNIDESFKELTELIETLKIKKNKMI